MTHITWQRSQKIVYATLVTQRVQEPSKNNIPTEATSDRPSMSSLPQPVTNATGGEWRVW